MVKSILLAAGLALAACSSTVVEGISPAQKEACQKYAASRSPDDPVVRAQVAGNCEQERKLEALRVGAMAPVTTLPFQLSPATAGAFRPPMSFR